MMHGRWGGDQVRWAGTDSTGGDLESSNGRWATRFRKPQVAGSIPVAGSIKPTEVSMVHQSFAVPGCHSLSIRSACGL